MSEVLGVGFFGKIAVVEIGVHILSYGMGLSGGILIFKSALAA